MSHPAMNESLKFSERPSVIFSYPKPKISTPDASTAEDSETDLSEDEVELTNEMLLDLKNNFNTIKESFNNGNVIGQKTDQSDGVSLDEAIVVNSANLETKSVTIGDAVGINGVSNDNVTNDDVTKEDITKDDVIKEDVTKISTQNAQSETKRTKTSQKRPSKSNIQFQVPKKLQVLHQNTQTTAHWYNFDGLPHKNHYVTNPTCIGVTNIGGHTLECPILHAVGDSNVCKPMIKWDTLMCDPLYRSNPGSLLELCLWSDKYLGIPGPQ